MRKGFTLLELVVVIVVIGILAAIAIPTFAGVISRAHVASAKTSAEAVVADAKAMYAFDNAGSQDFSLTVLNEAAGELTPAVTFAAGTGGNAAYWVATIDGKTARVLIAAPHTASAV